MVGYHVAQCASLFVVSRATANTSGLRRCNLDVVDVVAVPDRFKHRVAEAKDEDVLDCVFAEVVIDAINLALFEYRGDSCVQLFCGFEIAPEGLFNNNPAPMLPFLRETGFAEAFHDYRKKRWRRREIEEMILAGALRGYFIETCSYIAVG